MEMEMSWLTTSIGRCLQEGKLPSVPEERRLEQSLFPARLHPRCALLQKQLLSAWEEAYGSAWAEELKKMHVNNIASLAGYFWPNTTSDMHALTLIKLMQWITLLDDVVDDLDCPQADKLCHRLIHHIFGCSFALTGEQQLDLGGDKGIHANEPLIISVGLEWWKEIQANTSTTQQARFATEFTHFLLNQQVFLRLRENLKRQARTPVEEYILTRRASSGCTICVAMVEYDVGIELDEETLKNPLLQQFHEAVCDHGAFINDILSFPKEFANGDMLNLLPLLHMSNNEGKAGKEGEEVGFQEAVSQAWKMAYAREQEAAGLAQQLMKKKAGLKRYVEAVGSFSAGLWAATLQSPRYKLPPPLAHAPPPFGFSHPPTRSCLSNDHLSNKNPPFLYMPLVHFHSFKRLSLPRPLVHFHSFKRLSLPHPLL